jgi:1-acyl-sn-glycerol-3-phosphate acyltransferase
VTPAEAAGRVRSPQHRAKAAGVLQRALSLLFWLFLATSSVVLYPVALLIWAVTVVFDRRRVLLHRFTCFWASLYTWLNPVWRVRIEGREKIRPEAAYVMVANHQSMLDILVLFRLFAHFKWVSKIENFRIPFIGWNMSLNRYIKLRRGSRESVAMMMHQCEMALAGGNSIMMFPEGTRSPDGHLRAFKPGAFTLAQRAAVPILPIVVEGTAAALPKRGFVLRGRHQIRVRVLDEIDCRTFAEKPADLVAEEVHERFTVALGTPGRSRIDQPPRDSSGGLTERKLL